MTEQLNNTQLGQLNDKKINNNNDSTQKDNQIQNKDKWIRKEQPLILFIMITVIGILTAIQLPVLFSYRPRLKTPQQFMLPTLIENIIRIIIILINSYYMGGMYGILRSYTMLDVLGILGLCTGGMFVAFILTFTIPTKIETEPFFISIYITSLLVYVAMTGNFRLMMITCKWQKSRVLIYKLMLYGSALFYIGYGVYYSLSKLSGDNTSSRCSLCDPTSGNCDSSCKSAQDCCFQTENLLKQTFASMSDFIIMISGTGLAYNGEMIGFMSDYDGVNQMKIRYTLGIQEENDQIKSLNLTLQNSNYPEVNRQRPNELPPTRVWPNHELISNNLIFQQVIN